MKRIERQPPRQFFTRAERTRLISLIFFLIVLVMLIQSSGNPDLWSHWVGKGGQQRVGDKERNRRLRTRRSRPSTVRLWTRAKECLAGGARDDRKRAVRSATWVRRKFAAGASHADTQQSESDCSGPARPQCK